MNARLFLIPALGLLACNHGKLNGDCATDTCIGTSSDGGATDGGATDGGTGTDGGTMTDGGTPTDGGTVTDGGGTECPVGLVSSSPADGDTGVDLGVTVKFTLDDADPTASVTLASVDGSSVAGSFGLSSDDTEVWFQADSPLAATTDYVATLDWCGGNDTVLFTTTDPGDPVDSLVGNAYNIDLAGATWVKPAGVGGLLSGYLTAELMLSVSDLTTDTITMFGALGDGTGSQDTCLPTIDFPTADFTANPFFQLGPSDVMLDIGGYSVTMNDFRMSGSFSADASQIEGGTVDAELDARDLVVIFESVLGTSDPDALCGLLSSFGASCEVCSSDSQPYCIAVALEDVQGDLLRFGLDAIDQADCHPDCAASWGNPDCDTSSF